LVLAADFSSPALVLLVPMHAGRRHWLLVIAMNCVVGLASSMGPARIVWSSVALVAAGRCLAASGALNRRAPDDASACTQRFSSARGVHPYRNLPAALAGDRRDKRPHDGAWKIATTFEVRHDSHHSRSLGILAFIAWLSAHACRVWREDRPRRLRRGSVDWPGLVNEWIESDLKANPAFAVIQGRHEYDGLLADWSDAGLAAEIARLKSWQSKVAAIDAAALSDRQKFERDYMLAVLDGNLFWLETADWPPRTGWYAPGSIRPSILIATPTSRHA
jgi:hypothetical protein